MARIRRRLTDFAQQAGVGPVARVHRQFRSAVAVVALCAIAAVPAGLGIFGMVLSESPQWREILLAYAGLVGLTVAWSYWGPVNGLPTRCWYAVADGGLVAWEPRQDDAPTVTRWSEVPVELAHELPTVSGRADLVRAIQTRRPVLPRRRGLLVGSAVGVLASGLVLWFAAVPLALDVVVGERPGPISDLARMCTGGNSYGRTAAYEGAGSHPVAVYDGYGGYPAHIQGFAPTSETWPSGEEVQLVACLRELAHGEGLGSCPYEGGYTVSVYQGSYRVDVYEARSGNKVDTFTIDGKNDAGDCSPSIFVGENDSDDERSYTTGPSDADYAAAFEPLVTGTVPEQGEP